MRKWTRWQDWVALVAGVYAFLSPLWTQTTTRATWTMVVLGVLLAANALWALAAPGAVASEYIHAALGLLMFVSPWVLGFAGITPMAWTAWIVGLIALATGIWAIPYSNRAHHQAVPQS
jgi:hypothetical protein